METRRTEYMDKLDDLGREVDSMSRKIGDLHEEIEEFDGRLNHLPVRISRVRKMNYRVMTHLEQIQLSVSDRWAETGPAFKERMHSRIVEMRAEIQGLKRRLSRRRDGVSFEVVRLRSIESRIGILMSRVEQLDGDVSDILGKFKSRLEELEQDLKIAEVTVDLTSRAAFSWKEGESAIYAVEAKDLNNEIDGVVTLTNQRFIFEGEKEIVLKKTFFIATEKKKVREVVVDKPIGIIDEMHKGRVGFLAGYGVFITFKPNSRLKEMKLDTKGHEADSMLRFYNFVVSGEAETELADLEEKDDVEKKEERGPLVCEICGAPYTAEVYRGQTSVQCKYCGAVISVSR